ncbi:MAG: hypothetical protein ACAI34_25820 [Verrucomicrobium sp.]
MLSSAFASILKSGREDFNAQYALAKRQYPALEAGAFSSFMETTVDPVVAAVHKADPEAAVSTAQAAYEVALELAGQRLVGPGARSSWVQQAWQRVLLAVPGLVASAPRRVLGSISNAAHQLATTPGARPEAWLQIMECIAPQAPDVDSFLKAGQLAAWRSGLAHYRESALAVAEFLDPSLLSLVLDDKEAQGPLSNLNSTSPSDAASRLADLRAHRWATATATASSTRPQLVQRNGSFRGFGGLFQEPPRVVVDRDQNQIFVRSGTEGWLLTADAFGATFHRATEEELAAASPQIPQVPTGIEVPPDVGPVTSVARLSHTVAITGALTHAVLIYAVPHVPAQASTPPPLPT